MIRIRLYKLLLPFFFLSLSPSLNAYVYVCVCFPMGQWRISTYRIGYQAMKIVVRRGGYFGFTMMMTTTMRIQVKEWNTRKMQQLQGWLAPSL